MLVGGRLSWRIVITYTGWPVALHVLLATGISLAYQYLGVTRLAVPALPVTVLAATIGILLTFRNNSAYDRWWEARTQWGALVNTSRTYARQLLTFLPIPTTREEARASSLPQTPLLRTAGEYQPAVTHEAAGDGAVRDRFGAARGAVLSRTLVTEHGVRVKHAGDVVDHPDKPFRAPWEGITSDARELVYAQLGFVNALRHHLRRQDPFPSLEPFFRPAVLGALREEKNVPTAILVWASARLRRIFAETPGPEALLRLTLLDGSLSELMNILGACERIKNTPIPRQYDVLPLVMVRVYLVFLPLGVVSELGMLTPLVTAVIAFLFTAMDAVGRDVEAPFEDGYSDTPMTALCRTIEINLRQMLGEKELPPPLQPENGLLY